MSKTIEIKNKKIGLNEKVFVIAEVGINHDGNFDTCQKMIIAASNAGADAVKLQIVEPEESYVTGTDSYIEFKNKALTTFELEKLMDVSRRLNIILFATPGDFSSVRLMKNLGMPAVKISSGLLTNTPLIKAATDLSVPILISTGMGHEAEVEQAISVCKKNGVSDIALLHCISLYPSPDSKVNLRRIWKKEDRFNLIVGYSDHTLDDLACTSAVAMGATIIEKHFTLDSTKPGADHKISMEPKAFGRMVKKIRRITNMRGDLSLDPIDEENIFRAQRHRCLVARCDIGAGEVFTAENIALKRLKAESTGLPANAYEKVLGLIANKKIPLNTPIQTNDLGL